MRDHTNVKFHDPLIRLSFCMAAVNKMQMLFAKTECLCKVRLLQRLSVCGFGTHAGIKTR